MKKIILTLSALLCVFSLNAQSGETILSNIEKACGKGVNVSGRFSEVRKSADKAAAPVILAGKLAFKGTDNLEMIYDNGNKFLIEGKVMTIVNDGVKQTFDLTKNLMMKGLSQVLICSFTGQLPTLAAEQNAIIMASKEAKDYVVTLKAQKKAVRGFNRVIVHYDATTCKIKSMMLEEFSGAITSYDWAK